MIEKSIRNDFGKNLIKINFGQTNSKLTRDSKRKRKISFIPFLAFLNWKRRIFIWFRYHCNIQQYLNVHSRAFYIIDLHYMRKWCEDIPHILVNGSLTSTSEKKVPKTNANTFARTVTDDKKWNALSEAAYSYIISHLPEHKVKSYPITGPTIRRGNKWNFKTAMSRVCWKFSGKLSQHTAPVKAAKSCETVCHHDSKMGAISKIPLTRSSNISGHWFRGTVCASYTVRGRNVSQNRWQIFYGRRGVEGARCEETPRHV